ncbi:hypothetical protein KI387_017820, partial [Taxus chinensis]
TIHEDRRRGIILTSPADTSRRTRRDSSRSQGSGCRSDRGLYIMVGSRATQFT